MKSVQIINGRRVVYASVPKSPPDVSSAALWDAFTDDEQEVLASHTNAKVKAFLQALSIKPDIPKRQALVILNRLEVAGVLAAGRANEIVNALR